MFRLIATVAICGWAGLAFWIVIPSSVFIQPTYLAFRDGQFYFARLTPWGSVSADWTQEVRSGLCEASVTGSSPYQERGDAIVPYEPDPKLLECIPEAGGPFIVDVSRRVRIWGSDFTLRSSRTVWECPSGFGRCINTTQ